MLASAPSSRRGAGNELVIGRAAEQYGQARHQLPGARRRARGSYSAPDPIASSEIAPRRYAHPGLARPNEVVEAAPVHRDVVHPVVGAGDDSTAASAPWVKSGDVVG